MVEEGIHDHAEPSIALRQNMGPAEAAPRARPSLQEQMSLSDRSEYLLRLREIRSVCRNAGSDFERAWSAHSRESQRQVVRATQNASDRQDWELVNKYHGAWIDQTRSSSNPAFLNTDRLSRKRSKYSERSGRPIFSRRLGLAFGAASAGSIFNLKVIEGSKSSCVSSKDTSRPGTSRLGLAWRGKLHV